MMDWLLQTMDFREDGIFSELRVDGDLFCVTLEHAYPNNGLWAPKLPRGATYRCVRGLHRLRNYNKGDVFETFEITGVSGHSGILFHPGNKNEDSDGCVLVGKKRDQTITNIVIVTHSRDTFARLMEELKGIDDFMLRVA